MNYLITLLFSCCLALIFFRPFISDLAFYESSRLINLVFSIIATTIIAINKNKIKHNSIDFFILLFILSLAVSLITSRDLVNSLNKIPAIISCLTAFYLIRCIDKELKEKVTGIIIVSAIIICGYGIYQYFWGFRHYIESFIRNQIDYPFAYEWISRKRVFSVFFAPNAFAGFLIMALPLAYGMKQIPKNAKTSLRFLLLIGFLLSVNLLLTQSVSAILSLVLSFFFILLITKPKKTWSYASFFLGIAVIVIIFYSRSMTDKGFITPLFSFEKRIEYYQEALMMIKQRPFLGIGLGNFEGQYSLFVHNSYLQVWIELGALGIISLVGIIFSTIKKAIKTIAAGSQAKTYTLSLLCAFLAFSIHNLMDFTFFLPEVSWLWWIIIALIIS